MSTYLSLIEPEKRMINGNLQDRFEVMAAYAYHRRPEFDGPGKGNGYWCEYILTSHWI